MIPNMNYTETISYPVNGSGEPASSWNTVSSGSNQGLYAELIPMTLQVIAARPSGAEINITRNVEVALIPVFQFGVFCGYDCSYFAGPNFAFGGRVHTNQNLFLASGANLVFDDKVSAYQQIMMDELENGHLTSSGYGGTVYVPKASGGCALAPIPPSGEAELCRPSRRHNDSRRCQLERRLSLPWPARPTQFSPAFPRDFERIPDQLAHRRQGHGVALCAEWLHQQPAALHGSDIDYS